MRVLRQVAHGLGEELVRQGDVLVVDHVHTREVGDVRDAVGRRRRDLRRDQSLEARRDVGASAIHDGAGASWVPAERPGVWSNTDSTVMTHAYTPPVMKRSHQLLGRAVGLGDGTRRARAVAVEADAIGGGRLLHERGVPLELHRLEGREVGGGERDRASLLDVAASRPVPGSRAASADDSRRSPRCPSARLASGRRSASTVPTISEHGDSNNSASSAPITLRPFSGRLSDVANS